MITEQDIPSRLDAQMAFLQEIDKLKTVDRATDVFGDRAENSAEHSWHLALYALILSEHARSEINVDRVIRMMLLHDIVEIDAGDTPIFGAADPGIKDAEEKAAKRIFGLLPDDQAREALALWHEFEAAESVDAIFAKSLDRFQPPNQNLATGGGSWKRYKVTRDRIEARVKPPIERGAPKLFAWLSPKLDAFFSRSE